MSWDQPSSIAAMPGKPRRTLPARALAAPLAAAAIAFAGCGSDDDATIPEDASENLLNRLEQVSGEVEAGRCETAAAEAEGFKTDVDGLSGKVEPEVHEALVDSADQLVELTANQCEETEENATGVQGDTPTTETEAVEPEVETTPETEEDATTDDEPTDEEEDSSSGQSTEPQPGDGASIDGGGETGSDTGTGTGADTGGGSTGETGSDTGNSGGIAPRGGERGARGQR
jgi:hypothetical protein